jgi:hypothetical protein
MAHINIRSCVLLKLCSTKEMLLVSWRDDKTQKIADRHSAFKRLPKRTRIWKSIWLGQTYNAKRAAHDCFLVERRFEIEMAKVTQLRHAAYVVESVSLSTSEYDWLTQQTMF